MGDLDAIVLQALRKEPERRYGTAEELSEDIRRHLEGLPVTARKDGLAYRAGRLVRRNRAAAVTALAMAVSAAVPLSVFVYRWARVVGPDPVGRDRRHDHLLGGAAPHEPLPRS